MRRRGPRPAEDRLRRLLVMLPWLMERGEVPAAEVAERFKLTQDELKADLELVAMCGLPPFVDELIDVFIDEGMVFVGVPRLFTRPLRLNSVEAFELLTAGRAAMELPGADADGPLARGLAKLATALGEAADGDASVLVDLDRPPLTDAVVAAAERNERISVEYWSASSDELTERTITPHQVYADRGNWYVTASDERSGDVRTFRIDRIESIVASGVFDDERPADLPRPGEWFADGSVPRATMRFSPSARWVIERYPVDDIGEPDDQGRVTAVVPVATQRWLERVLVRLGGDVEVLEPASVAALGPRAAGRVLERYRRS